MLRGSVSRSASRCSSSSLHPSVNTFHGAPHQSTAAGARAGRRNQRACLAVKAAADTIAPPPTASLDESSTSPTARRPRSVIFAVDGSEDSLSGLQWLCANCLREGALHSHARFQTIACDVSAYDGRFARACLSSQRTSVLSGCAFASVPAYPTSHHTTCFCTWLLRHA